MTDKADETDKEARENPDPARRCNRCAHYFITHDVSFRYGCRALNFKSQQPPIREVIAASGQDCLYFEAKPPRHS